MKSKYVGVLAAFIALMFSVTVAAAANKKTMYLNERTVIGSTTLQPGEYTVEWKGDGPDVEVSFSRGNKTVLTVPATIAMAHNSSDESFRYRTDESGARLLVQIRTKNATLTFTPSEVSSQN